MSAEISEMLNYLIINEILLEDWFSDDEKAVLDEIEDWSATPVLSDKLSDAIITDIAEALVILTNDVVAETQ